MAPIPLFRAVQKDFDALGLYAPPQRNQSCQFNRKNTFYILTEVEMCILTSALFIFNAKSAYEYTNSFYISITTLGVVVTLTVLLYKMRAIRNLIENYEQFIAKRKRRSQISF